MLQEWVETATFNGLGHLVTGSNDGSINVFDVESGNCISKRWNNGNHSHAVSRLGTSYPTHDTRHASQTTRHDTHEQEAHVVVCVAVSDRRITCMQASPLRLVSGSMDGLIRHWDFAPAF